jgi:hypothetical protein
MEFERVCLRTILGPLRIRLAVPTRHPKERPSSLPYEIINNEGHREIVMIPAAHVPQTFVLMKLDPPTLLSGKPPDRQFHRGDIWASYDPADLHRMQTTYRARQFVLGPFDVTAFTRMLAKIAYAHAVARMGYGSFEPLILDVIFNKTDTPSHWVGGAPGEIPQRESIVHQLWLDDDHLVNGQNYVAVDVRLFSFLETPRYRIVVGKR